MVFTSNSSRVDYTTRKNFGEADILVFRRENPGLGKSICVLSFCLSHVPETEYVETMGINTEGEAVNCFLWFEDQFSFLNQNDVNNL